MLPAQTLRRLTCDGTVVCSHERDGTVLDAGRRTRTIAPALRRALARRDGGCRFPGCQSTRHLDAHHIEHWADGGRTDRDNLVLLCRRHHRLLHEGGFELERRPGCEVTFRTPSGPVLPHRPIPRRGCPLDPPRLGVPAGTPNAIATGDALPYDLNLTIDSLLAAAPPGSSP